MRVAVQHGVRAASITSVMAWKFSHRNVPSPTGARPASRRVDIFITDGVIGLAGSVEGAINHPNCPPPLRFPDGWSGRRPQKAPCRRAKHSISCPIWSLSNGCSVSGNWHGEVVMSSSATT
jgi:hypothetical protein